MASTTVACTFPNQSLIKKVPYKSAYRSISYGSFQLKFCPPRELKHMWSWHKTSQYNLTIKCIQCGTTIPQRLNFSSIAKKSKPKTSSTSHGKLQSKENTIETEVAYFYYNRAQGKHSPFEETRFRKEDLNHIKIYQGNH